jgi:uncharacterized protein YcbX
MLFTVDGLSEHEEDTWEGRRVKIGDVTIRVAGPVDRCVMITRPRKRANETSTY